MKLLAVIAIIVVTTICLSPSAESAESALELGSISLGGTLSFQTTSIDGADDNLNTLALAPSAMVYLYNGLGVGVELSFLHMSMGEYSTASHRYLGIVQYVFPLEAVVKPFIHLGFGFIRVSEGDDYDYGGDHSENGWTMKTGLGMYTFLNDHFAIKVGADFIHDTLMISEGDAPSTNTVMFSVGFEGFVF